MSTSLICAPFGLFTITNAPFPIIDSSLFATALPYAPLRSSTVLSAPLRYINLLTLPNSLCAIIDFFPFLRLRSFTLLTLHCPRCAILNTLPLHSSFSIFRQFLCQQKSDKIIDSVCHHLLEFSFFLASFVVPCPDANHCHPLVDCIFDNATIPFISCGNCPDGYSGNGIKCKPKCSNCDRTKEICTAPEICTEKCQKCQNGGKCGRTGKCRCKNGFKGSTCEKLPRSDKMLGSCLTKPCLNGGLCSALSGKCTCPPGFKGRRCQKSLNERKSKFLNYSGPNKIIRDA